MFGLAPVFSFQRPLELLLPVLALFNTGTLYCGFHAHLNRLCDNAVLCFSQSKMLIKPLSSDTCVYHRAMGNAEDFKAPLTRCIHKGLLKCFRDMGSNCLLTVSSCMIVWSCLVSAIWCLCSNLHTFTPLSG